jgi:sulfate adenylyltransferase subunit 2
LRVHLAAPQARATSTASTLIARAPRGSRAMPVHDRAAPAASDATIASVPILTAASTVSLPSRSAPFRPAPLEGGERHIFREVVAESERPVLLYSMGKDSAVMLHLARKAFHPRRRRSRCCTSTRRGSFARCTRCATASRGIGMELIVHVNPEAAALGSQSVHARAVVHTDLWKTAGTEAGARRARLRRRVRRRAPRRGELARKERIVSFRSPVTAGIRRPAARALAALQPAQAHGREPARFPLSNWTELDVWEYIAQERIDVVPLYFAARARSSCATAR